ncbi:secretoglobin family 1D member-like [Crocuta crocuta]
MKLFLSVLLVTLALCCYEVNAIACPTFVGDTKAFLMLPKYTYEPLLRKYHAPPEKVQALLDVKTCTEKISLDGKKELSTILR